MTISLSGWDEDDEKGMLAPVGASSKVHVNQLPSDEKEVILETSRVGRGALSSLEDPSDVSIDSLRGRVSERGLDVYLALEAVKLGLLKDGQLTDQLNRQIDEAKEIQRKIDLLLKLQAKIPAEGGAISPEARDLLARCQEAEIDLPYAGAGELSKEEAARLKAQAESRVTGLRTDLQTKITTEIQPTINTQSTIMDILKEIVRQNSRLLSTISHNSVKR